MKMGKLLRLPTDEAVLLKQCRRAQPAAQRELYEHYSGEMLAVCRRYLGQLEEAEEVLSNSFIKIFARIDQYRGEGALGAWIRRIVVREALNHLRYRKNWFEEWEGTQSENLGSSPLQDHYDCDYLLHLIDQLPIGYKTVFNLYAIEGYKHKEIAEMLKISENTSKSQLSKARCQLQAMLQTQDLNLKKST